MRFIDQSEHRQFAVNEHRVDGRRNQLPVILFRTKFRESKVMTFSTCKHLSIPYNTG